MLEIKLMSNLDYGIEEAEKAKGEDPWYLTDLTRYIEKNRVKREILNHLCAFSVETFERCTFREIDPRDKTRLISDLESGLLYTYYTEDERNFDVELKDGYLNFYLDGSCISKITLKKFEDDLKEEPDIKLNSLFEFQGDDKLQHERLTYKEREALANKVVDIYNEVLEQRSYEMINIEEERRKAKEEKKKKKGFKLFGKK